MSRAWGHRPGLYIFTDEITGEEAWSDVLAEDWDGTIRHVDNLDGEHPDYWAKNIPPERFPRLMSEGQIDVYVTAAVTFYAGTDVPRLRE